MVMHYESGRSLQEHVLRNRNKDQKDVLSERFIRRVFAHVMNGLREVHSNRLLHLDVKPGPTVYLRMDGTPSCSTLARHGRHCSGISARPIRCTRRGFAAPESISAMRSLAMD
jgi:serine/threonine protein kinase